jgi:hypothetical protein
MIFHEAYATLHTTDAASTTEESSDENADSDDSDDTRDALKKTREKKWGGEQRLATCEFTPDGTHLYVGSSKGVLYVLTSATLVR